MKRLLVIIECFFIVVVAFLLLIIAVPIGVTFSSDADLEIEDDNDIKDDGYELKTIVTVRHQDEFGNDLLLPYATSINYPGELYVAVDQSEQLPEYDLLLTLGNTVGFHEEDDIEVIFVYRRRPLIAITPNEFIVQLGDVINYTVIITNNATNIIADRYIVQIQFDQVGASLQQLEFVLEYLAIGDTIINFSTTINQSASVGHKNVRAVLIHPDILNIGDTQVTTQIEIIDPVIEPPIQQSPPSPESGTTSPRPVPTEPPSAIQPPARPESAMPPVLNPNIIISSELEMPLNNETDSEYDEEDEADLEDELYDDSEAGMHPQDDVIIYDDDINTEEIDNLLEVVEIEVEEIKTKPTITMIGTFVYDVTILVALDATLFKKRSWLKK